MIEDHPILLFDGVCNLCNGLVQFIIKRDPKAKFRFAPLQSESGQALLGKFGLPKQDFDSFVFIQGDKYFLKSSAVIHLLKEMGGGWKLFYVFVIIPKPLRNFVYFLVARTENRIFGKRDTCMVPTPEIEKRFLP